MDDSKRTQLTGNLLLSRLATPSTIKKGGLSYTTTPIESVSIVMDMKCS